MKKILAAFIALAAMAASTMAAGQTLRIVCEHGRDAKTSLRRKLNPAGWSDGFPFKLPANTR